MRFTGRRRVRIFPHPVTRREKHRVKAGSLLRSKENGISSVQMPIDRRYGIRAKLHDDIRPIGQGLGEAFVHIGAEDFSGHKGVFETGRIRDQAIAPCVIRFQPPAIIARQSGINGKVANAAGQHRRRGLTYALADIYLCSRIEHHQMERPINSFEKSDCGHDPREASADNRNPCEMVRILALRIRRT
ncbi:hypothetical protein GGE56_001914 [Rhizobium leguminosarum]|nr:hypothetical protein [Rhizobium leguminosarum]MBB6293637.1 hypothetical protein [Rhizobium leguminosarum]